MDRRQVLTPANPR